MKNALALALALLLVGCASAPTKQAIKINPGMTKDEVTAIAGQPLDRSFVGAQERWVYGSDEPGSPRKVVTFRSGKVVGLDTEITPEKGATPPSAPVIPANGPIPDLPCADHNQFGAFAEGGGCNMYGCFPPGGYCNNWGCSAQGVCTAKKCPRRIDTYRCVE
jgi:hypothetical protein